MKHTDNVIPSAPVADLVVNVLGIFIICSLVYKGTWSLLDPNADVLFNTTEQRTDIPLE